ncbi:MAG TPA: M15 family metallopeptidase [Candidatus Dormibacteraeota bacterium]|nr:M15 family metallopeptidase [Candidatus Dormibacteraeota bacterium]
MKKHLSVILLVLIALVGVYVIGRSSPPLGSQGKPKSQQVTTHAQTFDKTLYSLSDPTSLWVIVNKKRPLNPINYAPPDLTAPNIPLRLSSLDPEMHVRAAMAIALQNMTAVAKTQNINLMLASGYRSYSEQVTVYGAEVKDFGQKTADQESARPGYSEHQSGWAADLEPTSRQCEVEQCFANLPEGKWLASNAYKYGFIIRYPVAKQLITGYEYEPWHVRYVGTYLASAMHNQGILTLEEFFGLPAAPDY